MCLIHLGAKMLLLYIPSGPSKPAGQLGHTPQGPLQGIDKAAECVFVSNGCLWMYFTETMSHEPQVTSFKSFVLFILYNDECLLRVVAR